MSTALLYSFAQRPDTRVVDEPLYAHYLRVSGAQHPGRDEVLEAQNQDGEAVVREIVLGPCDRSVLFVKHMAHHLAELRRDFLQKTVNVLLVRDPEQMLPSLVHQIPEPTLADTGLSVQSELYDQLRAAGDAPPVLDSRELLLDPEGVLRALCRRIGLAFDPGMLGWTPGARAEDGVWAKHWYHSVHTSTGFQPFKPKSTPFPEALKPLLAECQPHYRKLASVALRAESPAS